MRDIRISDIGDGIGSLGGRIPWDQLRDDLWGLVKGITTACVASIGTTAIIGFFVSFASTSPCSADPDDEDDDLVRVRHYSRNITAIKSSGRILINRSMGPYIWVEYPITTGFDSEGIQETTSSFFRGLNEQGGFVEFNIERELLRQDPNLPDVPNSKVIAPVDANNPQLAINMLQNGLSLLDPKRNAVYYDWDGNRI